MKHQINFETEHEIRSATLADLDKITWSSNDLKGEYYIKKWAQKEQGKLDMYVAIIDDFPIGYIWLDWTKLAQKNSGEISSFAILEPFRSKGIGRSMMAEMENILLQKGLKVSQTGFNKENLRAGKLYQKLGYKIIGDTQSSGVYTLSSGEKVNYFEDCWVMTKALF